VAASIGGLILVQRAVPPDRREVHNDVAGFMYAVLGVAYAVLLGLMLVAVWQDYETAQTSATQEANAVATVFWLARGLPKPQAHRTQELARFYARVVAKEEWPLMRRDEVSPKAWALLDELRGVAVSLHPETVAEATTYDNEAQAVSDLGDARRDRLLEADQGLPALLWVVLLVGGVITVGFTYLFGLRSTLVHTTMVAALALTIAMVLFTISALDYPFRGAVRVGPDAFQSVLHRMDQSKLSEL
jgi:Protein of unknown function (DUF4239)